MEQFIDSFFKTPGWDIDNQGGLNEEFKDAGYGDTLRVDESAAWAPDYSFRIGEWGIYVRRYGSATHS